MTQVGKDTAAREAATDETGGAKVPVKKRSVVVRMLSCIFRSLFWLICGTIARIILRIIFPGMRIF
jgi:hypothetical protein